MKKDIHPKYGKLSIKIGEDIFETNSTKIGEYLMDVDYRKHPAWTGSTTGLVNDSNVSISNFNKKFGGLTFGLK